MDLGVGVKASGLLSLRPCLVKVFFSIVSGSSVVIVAAWIDWLCVFGALLARSVPDMTEVECD